MAVIDTVYTGMTYLSYRNFLLFYSVTSPVHPLHTFSALYRVATYASRTHTAQGKAISLQFSIYCMAFPSNLSLFVDCFTLKLLCLLQGLYNVLKSNSQLVGSILRLLSDQVAFCWIFCLKNWLCKSHFYLPDCFVFFFVQLTWLYDFIFC